MPKRIIKRFMPDQQLIRDHKHLQFLGTLLHDPNIFHLTRRSVSGAFSVGLFMAFVPVPFQMVLAAIGAIVARVNLPIAVALVWITNPLTMPPIFYGAYKVGAWILDTPVRNIQFELTVEWITNELSAIWQPFLLGCFISGLFFATLGNVAIRLFWRWHVNHNWRKRKQARAAMAERNRKQT
ncbi:MAG TPA: DUF2062 domain-containing protein [Gammaproteobacteria bacterium]|nr:DUF2062 domain-containing protein [Gammaproteobacteria bacterium]